MKKFVKFECSIYVSERTENISAVEPVDSMLHRISVAFPYGTLNLPFLALLHSRTIITA